MSAPETTPTLDIEFTDTELAELIEVTEVTEIEVETETETPVSNVFTGLPAELIEALRQQGIVTPTAVQEAVIPDGMAGHDVPRPAPARPWPSASPRWPSWPAARAAPATRAP